MGQHRNPSEKRRGRYVKRRGNPEDLTDEILYTLYRYGIGQSVTLSIDDIAEMYGIDPNSSERSAVQRRLFAIIDAGGYENKRRIERTCRGY